MKRLRRPLSLRIQLTFWYTGAMLVALAVYATVIFVVFQNNLSRALDERLRADFQWPAQMLRQLPNGRVEPNYNADQERGVSPWLKVWSSALKTDAAGKSFRELLFSTWATDYLRISHSERLAVEADGRIVSLSESAQQDPPVRVLSGESTIDGHPVVIQVALSERPLQMQLEDMLRLILLGLPLGVVMAGLGGYSLARRALAPVDRMAERARSITAERLGDRLPVGNPDDELGRLALVFNETLGRLESSFEQMRRFTADASHELRTPLTAIRSVGEVGLRGKRDAAAYREIIGSMLEEVDRLARLVDRLLTLSRADNRDFKLAADQVDLAALAEEIAGQMDVLAEEKQQSIAVERHGAPQWTGDPLVLRQALMNLVDNAIKYTPAGGRVTIRVAQSGGEATIDVSDTGPGIPPELESKIFDRFYRVDKSRSRDNGGMGLGLSIARWAVEVQGGRLTLEKTSPAGSTFRIALPETAVPRPAEASLA